jgi:2-dehydro-3-deoxyphosphogluconate aldolase/(4S)-4-hydroxy-2-oxoglutarate aldolase
MNTAEALAWIRRTKIVPVIRAGSSSEALDAVEALLEGGIDVLEITMTVPGAIEVVREVALKHGGSALVGAGTVLDAETAQRCVDAGAQFIVSPALDIGTIETCRTLGIAVAPGALTPTEVLTAWNAGADVVKVFPCDALGGASYLRSLKAPLPHVKLMPTGGVTLANVTDFLSAGADAVGVGSNLVDLRLLRDGRREDLVERARAFRAAVSG